MHRHQHQVSVQRSRTSFLTPSEGLPLDLPDDQLYSSFDPIPGTSAEWLMMGILSGEANPALVQAEQLDGLLELASSQLQGSNPSEWTPTLQMLSKILTSAQTPEIGLPVSSLLTDAFIQGSKEMQAAIRRALPEIDSLVSVASARRSFL